MVKDGNYGVSLRQIKHLLDSPNIDFVNVNNPAALNSLVYLENLITMIVGILEREIPEDQK